MKVLKFPFLLLFELVKINILKSISIICAVISFGYAGTFDRTISEYKVISQIKNENTYIYVYEDIENNKVVYKNFCDSKEMPIKDNKIQFDAYNGINILLWVIFGILSLSVLIVSILGDDVGWEFEDCWQEAFSTLIYCELENDVYYYFALGRMIDKRDRQIDRYSCAARTLNISSFRQLYRCPKYKTKRQNRENILNCIGIK